MDARPKTVRDILHTGDQYIIPLFQRYYSWTKEHWDKLRTDIWALMEDESKPVHFLGPLVCTPTSHFPGSVPAYQLIDGQQRLTTLTLILAAVRDVATSRKIENLGEEVSEDYLIHKRKIGAERYKILPRLADRDVLTAVIEGHDLTPYADSRIFLALKYFRRHVEHWAREQAETRLRQLLDTVTRRLALVVVSIDGENPYEIFEGLNSTGLPLEEADLIRNYVFMQVPLPKQQEFFDQHWEPLEDMFESDGTHDKIPMTPFYRDYLMKEGRYSKRDATFIDFKEHQRESNLTPEEQAKELSHFAALDLVLRRPQTVKKDNLCRVLCDIDRMDIATAYPLLLNLLDRNASGRLSDEDLEGCLQDLVSFVLRRSICGETTRSYGQWFVDAISVLGSNPRRELQSYWLNRRWPDDAALRESLIDFPIYRRESPKARAILEAIEASHKHKEKVNPQLLSIEHVMPQTIKNDSAGKSWKAMLGEKWTEIHERYVHTLGNLTLTGYNPDLSNSSFERKKELLQESHVVLNKYFEKLTGWTEESIKRRTLALADIVVRLWPRPATEVAYSPSAEARREPEGLSEKQKKSLEYWRELDSRLEERGFSPDLIVAKPTTSVAIPIGKTGSAEIQLGFNQQLKRVYVSLDLSGEVGEAIEKGLATDKQKIEQEAGYQLEWEPGDIYIADDGIGIWNREDWPIQHDWMGDRLDDYLRVLKPRVEKLEDKVLADPELRRKIEKRERMVEYWTACVSVLRDSTIQFREGDPNVGRNYSRFEPIDTGILFGAQYYSDKQLTCVYFGVSKKAGRKLRSLFKELAEERITELEAAIEEKLEWIDPYLSVYADARFDDKSDWPRQHQWIRRTGEILLREMRQRLNLE